MKKNLTIRKTKRPTPKKGGGYTISVESIRRAEIALEADLRNNEAKLTKSVSIAARQFMGSSSKK